MKLYCGIDLHANNSVISIQDERDNVRYEKRLPNDLGVIVTALRPFQEELQGCVTTGTGWSTVWQRLASQFIWPIQQRSLSMQALKINGVRLKSMGSNQWGQTRLITINGVRLD
jgi:hypothetical protein